MKIFISLLILLTLLFSSDAYSQGARGVVKEGLTIESKILGKPVRYTIYFPPDYEVSKQNYPVTYFLHGGRDNDTIWIRSGQANLTTDQAITDKTIPPMILVMPDAGTSRWINNYNNSFRYEDFFFKEFIPFIEANYRVRAEKSSRSICGVSVGGYGALVYALRHPDMFASCVTYSAAIATDEMIIGMPDGQWKTNDRDKVYGLELKGNARITEHHKSYSPFILAQHADLEKLKTVKLYLDCGDDDVHSKANALFHVLLLDLKVPHEYRVGDGEHAWTYWQKRLAAGVKFIGDNVGK